MEGFCRACLNKFNEPTELLQYCESNRRLFVYCTGLQVKRNDTFTFQLCKECYLNLKFSCKFKKQCRTSNKKFKTYLALKENGECIDFSTYLKNIEDTLSLRLPIASGSSTPAHQKNYDDDDNESTCTSIQNFMSDMLQGEEMLPTEARIIREVIQEEADILDDSLDSHWLQDDVSIEDDLGMDFNFAGFSTPRSIYNDHCYTPRRITCDKEDDPYYYSPKDTIQNLEGIQVPHDHKDMPMLDMAENNTASIVSTYENIIEPNNQETNKQYQHDMPLLDDCDIKLDGIVDDFITMDDLETGYDIESSVKPKNKDITIILNKGVASKVTNSPLTNELDYYMIKVKLNKMSDTSKLIYNKNNIDTVLNENKIDTINQSKPTQDFDQYVASAKLNLHRGQNIEHVYSPVKCELEQYINKAELKKKTNIAPNQNKNNKKYNEKCSIDRNLEIALKNDDSQEFSLDQLLISPQVSIRSGASTPTINNILFGNLTPRDTVVPDFGNNAIVKEPKTTDFIEEFLIDDCQRLITKKEPKKVEPRFKIVKDLNKLKESKVKTQRKIIRGNLKRQEELTKFKYKKQNNLNRGHKDIKKLKDQLKIENYKHCETSDSEMLDSEQTQSITEAELIDNKQAFEFVDENLYKTSDSEMLGTVHSHKIIDPINIKETVNFETENHCETTDSEMMNSKEVIHQIPKNDDDLDISISNLLRFDDNQSVDLNISIASDFLKDDTLQEHNNDIKLKDPEHLFKMPFSPPDNKYDLDKNLCKICDKTYKSKCALKIHFIKTHKQQLPRANRNRNVVPKICPKCGKRFRDQSNFHKHMKKHDEPDNIKCEYCTLEFPTRGRFKLHMKTHQSEIDKKANEDLVNNEQDKDGDDNSREREGKQTKTFVCTICGKVLKSSGNYRVHLRRHNKNYITKCEICQKGFFRKCDLEVHMATHNNDYPFECQICPKKYRSRHLLVGHMYRHMGKAIFKCEVCDRQFISKQYLKQHYRTDMCAQNRKALEEEPKASNVTVTYKPVVYKPSKTTKEIGGSPANVTKDELSDTIETDCQDSIEEEVKNKPSSCSPTEEIAANSS